MANIVAVSRERHATKGWRRPKGYGFAAAQAVASLNGTEFAIAALSMAIGFIEQSGRYVPVAVMSPVAGRNLFVGPAGQWLGTYIPLILRTYPFVLGRDPASEQLGLCINEDSGLVVEADTDTERFFESDGTPSSAMTAITDLLRTVELDRIATELAVAALAEAGVIQPWPFTVTIGDQQIPVKGLHRIAEAALNGLDDEKFLELRRSSGLALAQAQLLSMGHVGALAQLALIQQQLAQPPEAGTGDGPVQFN